MQYYSSMTLADYVSANWSDLDPIILNLYEKELDIQEELKEDVASWKGLYYDNLETQQDQLDSILIEVDRVRKGSITIEDLWDYVKKVAF